MSVIITATDFSDVATDAVYYACQMAEATGSTLTIVHSYTIPVAFNDNPMPIIPMEEGKEIADKSMAELLEELKEKFSTLSISSHIAYGDITETLKDYLNEVNPWLVVVGNSTSDDGYSWLGSSLLNTLRHIPCPVIAVPDDATYKHKMNMCFACDYKNVAEALPAERLMTAVNKADAKLHILNVDYNDKHYSTDTPYEMAQLRELLEPISPEYHNIESEDINEGILKFVDDNGIDLLVVTPHKHSFFESLFHKSHTKALVQKSKVPILAIHDKN